MKRFGYMATGCAGIIALIIWWQTGHSAIVSPISSTDRAHEITIHPDTLGRPIPSLTGFVYIDPRYVDPLRRIGTRRIGLDQLFDIAVPVSRMPDGRLHGDWSALDRSLDLVGQIGALPIVVLDFTPKVLSSYPYLENSVRRAVPPTSYEDWEQLVYETVRHVNGRRKTGVTHWAVWNEPDYGMFWNVDHHRYTRWVTRARDADLWTPSPVRAAATGQFYELARQMEYIRLYAASVRGALRADSTIHVGGPSTSSFNRRWIASFLDKCAALQLPVDFVCWHYPEDPDELRASVQWLRDWTARRGMPAPYAIITEWNVDHTPDRNDWTEALDVLDMNRGFVDVGLEAALYYQIGRVADATSQALTPIGLAFQGLGLLRGQQVECETSQTVRAMGTRDSDGRIAVVFWYRKPGLLSLNISEGTTARSLHSYTMTLHQENGAPVVITRPVDRDGGPVLEMPLTGRGVGTIVFRSDGSEESR